eukprot:5279466-Pleurochrysis_carterae.AAC.1
MNNKKGYAALQLHAKRWIRDLKLKAPSLQRKTLDVLYSTAYYLLSNLGPLPKETAFRLRARFEAVVHRRNKEDKAEFMYMMFLGVGGEIHATMSKAQTAAKVSKKLFTSNAETEKEEPAVQSHIAFQRHSSDPPNLAAIEGKKQLSSWGKCLSRPASAHQQRGEFQRAIFYDVCPRFLARLRADAGSMRTPGDKTRFEAFVLNEAKLWLLYIMSNLTPSEIRVSIVELHQEFFPGHHLDLSVTDPGGLAIQLRSQYVTREFQKQELSASGCPVAPAAPPFRAAVSASTPAESLLSPLPGCASQDTACGFVKMEVVDSSDE